MIKRETGFTLMEVIVVVIILGLIAGFGMVNYHKSMEQAYVKNVYSQLRMIHRGQKWYEVKNGLYYPFDGTPVTSVEAINNDLEIYLIPESDLSYRCFLTIAAGTAYSCTAERKAAGVTLYTFSVNQNPLSDTNPSCTAGTKPCP